MSQAFSVGVDGRTVAMSLVRCRDESSELQRLLELNPDLLPADQIDPDDPPRWLLIKREMPVQDPNDASDRWSIDLFFADHNGRPTLVECKRYADTRARREVMGQMLEYAANGHHYWNGERLKEYLEETHNAALASRFRDLRAEAKDPDQWCQAVAQELKEGRMRLVFFMEKAPRELKSIVEFLNDRTDRLDVLIVEARQYEHEGNRIVVPSLFGFTEQIRLEREARRSTSPGRARWTEERFLERLQEAELTDEFKRLATRLVELAKSRPDLKASWGTGTANGSLTIKRDGSGLIEIYTNGSVAFRKDKIGAALPGPISERYLERLGELLPDIRESDYPNLHEEVVSSRCNDLFDIVIEAVDAAARADETAA